MEFLDDRLRRKLIKRRGKLHAFDALVPAKTAVVIVDVTQSFLDNVPDGAALVAPINALTAAARASGAVVAWVSPTAPSRWRSAAQARLLFGAEQTQRLEHELGGGCLPAREMMVAPSDWQVSKLGHSAFFPGNCALPDRLAKAGIDTVIVAGLLTDVCVAASAKDAHESGYRVIVCSDAVAANEPQLHAMALRTLVRVYADVRPSGEIIGLLSGSA